MTATDELRRLLDERGAEHFDGCESTLWGYEQTSESTGAYRYSADEISGGFVNVWLYHLTPEQAVEATLGRGTCHAIVSDNLTESEGTGDAWADCSECGHLLFVLTDPSSKPPHYCPNCGRRVVSE